MQITLPGKRPPPTKRRITASLLAVFVAYNLICLAPQSLAADPPAGSTMSAVPYYLPALEFDIQFMWMLTSCQVVDGDPEVEFSIAIDVTQNIVPDPNQLYAFDYLALDKALKRTDLHVELYRNGTLRGINVTSTDKTATFLASILDIARGVLGIVSWRATSIAWIVEPEPPCSPSSHSALQLRRALRPQIQALSDQIDLIAARSPLTDSDKTLMQQSRRDLALKSEALARQEAALSHTQRIRWIPHRTDNTATVVPETAALERLLGHHRDDFGGASSVKVALCPLPEDDTCTWKTNDEPTGDHLVVYRSPTQASLRFHSFNHDGSTNEIGRRLAIVPQAGAFHILQLRNRAFDNKTLMARFAENGTLTEFRFVSAARAAAISQTLAQTVSTVESAAAASGARQLEQLQTKVALLKAEAELIEAQRALDTLVRRDSAN